MPRRSDRPLISRSPTSPKPPRRHNAAATLYVEGLALNGLANSAANSARDFAEATRLLDRAESVLRTAGCWWPLGVTLNLRTAVALMQGDPSRVLAYASEALPHMRALQITRMSSRP